MPQPYVDQFAKATASSSGWSGTLAACTIPPSKAGSRNSTTRTQVLAFVPYAFFVQHGAALHLAPLAQADVVGVGTEERWTLVGKAGGSVTDAKSLSGYTILSVAGYAPEFVKHSALAAWTLPSDVKNRGDRPDIEWPCAASPR